MDINSAFEHVAGLVSGIPTLGLLLGVGLWLTLRFSFIQIRAYKKGIKLLTAPLNDDAQGEVSAFQGLSTVLSGTIGTGNIAGVATAITMGGPGAIFWMWITAILGMATKFASCTLGHRFRHIDSDGVVAGGPMYTLKYGMNMPKLAAMLAFFVMMGSVTTGGMVQTNSVVDGLGYIFPSAHAHSTLVGAIAAILVGLVILGGIKRIGRVAAFIVPFMAVIYSICALFILILHAHQVPSAFYTIFVGAFNPQAVGGGTLGTVIQYGVARGLFSSEAGLGTAPIGLSAIRTRHPVKVGLVGMVGPSLDTLFICTLTALVIIVMGAWGTAQPMGLEGASLSAYAFGHGFATLGQLFAGAGKLVVGIGLLFFTYTTMVTWSYYGERGAFFLFGQRSVMPFRYLFLILLVVGASTPLRIVWHISDICNILMALPNLLTLVCLSGLVQRLSDEYFAYKRGEITQTPLADAALQTK